MLPSELNVPENRLLKVIECTGRLPLFSWAENKLFSWAEKALFQLGKEFLSDPGIPGPISDPGIPGPIYGSGCLSVTPVRHLLITELIMPIGQSKVM